MRVLHVYRTYFPETQGGLQEAIRQICGATTTRGVVNQVFCLAKQPRPARLEVDATEVVRYRSLFEIASCDFGSPVAIARFRALAQRVDLLHFHFPWPFGDLLGLCSPNVPMVLTYHSDIVRQRLLMPLYRPLMARFLARARVVVATSPGYAAGSEVLRTCGDRVEIVPLGIDLANLPAPEASRIEHWRQRLGAGFFLFVGVLRYYKGLQFLLQAARNTGLPVVIAGDGPERESLIRAAAGMPNVCFLGFISDADKHALYQLCGAVVFPSHLRSEAFGVTLLEAAANARPMISTELGTGTSYANRDGETGFVVPPADVDALAAAMSRLQADAGLRASLGTAARARVERMFGADEIARGYIGVYRRALGMRQMRSEWQGSER